MLRDYVASLAKTVNDISKTNLIVTSDLKTDYRTDKIGIVEGKIAFRGIAEGQEDLRQFPVHIQLQGAQVGVSDLVRQCIQREGPNPLRLQIAFCRTL